MTHVPAVAAEFDPPFIVARNPARLVLRAVGGAVLVGVGYWMTRGGVVSHRFLPETVVGIGWTAVALGLAIMAAVAVLLAKAGPVLIADRAGLTIRPVIGRETAVAWADMTGWGIAKLKKESLLVIGLRDPEGYVGTLQGMRRAAALQRARQIGSPVSVALGDLMVDRETLFNTLKHWFDRFGPEAEMSKMDDAAGDR